MKLEGTDKAWFYIDVDINKKNDKERQIANSIKNVRTDLAMMREQRVVGMDTKTIIDRSSHCGGEWVLEYVCISPY